ncbi:MAG TPA: Arc family DNA-binding protein [Leucothrix mucor]|uniref:Arc family DNA-binding protein n=1 Tax=Leucothrix mucor TaxID=45248 RepID=A0A7V2T0D2_LEUMU|nr:Arc family DNA-binding protein [Leucothrix mucor]
MKKDKQQVNPYPIRLTLGLREKLQDSANKNGRSLNAEMLLRLEATFNYDLENPANMDEVLRVEKIVADTLEKMEKEGKLSFKK